MKILSSPRRARAGYKLTYLKVLTSRLKFERIDLELYMERTREILTPDQAAEYLQVDRETIYRYIRQ